MTSDQVPTVPGQPRGKRRAVVLIAVLVVVVVLSLAGYQFLDMATSEAKVSHNSLRVVQARAYADSGVYYAAAMLSNSDNYLNTLNGNPWNNPGAFQNVQVVGDNGIVGQFSLIAPSDPEDGDPSSSLSGVIDESSKINLNALLKIDMLNGDPTGQTVYDALMKLPNMTDAIAGAIVDWMDPDSDPHTDGAENDYYQGLSPPYRCKNGPLDSIDELLLVKGVTPDLLYGSDYNRNGFQDPNETSSDGFTFGWASYLTVHSREQNYDGDGNLFTNLNGADVNALVTALNTQFADSPDLVKFIIMYRQLGPAATGGGNGGNAGGAAATPAATLDSYQLDLTKALKYSMTSLFELIDAQVSVKTTVNGKSVTATYQSPLVDPAVQKDLLPKLLSMCSLTDDQELPARVNVNTASRVVLLAIPNLADTDVDKIIAARPSLSSTDPPTDIFQTSAWLATEAQLSSDTLKQIDPYVTGRTQVYRVQSIGNFVGSKGPTIRVEAVIDTNGGRPRILAWRDLSELGSGLTSSNTP